MLALILNGTLGALLLVCAYLGYNTVAPLIREAPPAHIEIGPVQAEVAEQRPYSKYQVIAGRNLFQTRKAPGPPPKPVEEELQESRLPLMVIATLSSTRPGESVAVVEDLSRRERVAVRVGDSVAGGTIELIGRRHLIVNNAGKREKVSMDDRAKAGTSSAPPQKPGRARSRAASRLKEQAKRLVEKRRRRPRARAAGQRTPRRPIPAPDLTPYLAQVNLGENESVTRINGVSVEDPARTVDLIQMLSTPGPKRVVVMDESGAEREIVLDSP